MKTYKVTVDDYGTIRWYLKNKLHREDGPAVEWANGTKYWYLNDQCHREDGPAIECANGDKYWYLNDQQLTEAQFNARTKQPSCEGKVVEIDGKKYKLQEVK
jgi:hypothetical protein